MNDELTWVIGGPQGSGINVAAETLAKVCLRAGYFVHAYIEYHSNIMGEHSFYKLRISPSPTRSLRDPIDVLCALDEETLTGDLYREIPQHFGHRHEVREGGIILYPEGVSFKPDEKVKRGVRPVEIPFMKLLDKGLEAAGLGTNQGAKHLRLKNTVFLGASTATLGLPIDGLAEAFRSTFKKKPEIAEQNIAVAKIAFEFAQAQMTETLRMPAPIKDGKKRILMKGTEAVGIGKIKAGCAFQSYYPISPATDESVFLESRQRQWPLLVVQAEDEISAVCMAIGAAHGGARSSTSTSGPGFSLMAEAIGWAGITEAAGPVICLYQRGGPSTGLPTRHEQGDLRFAIHAGHGEFPRIVLAPGNPGEAFYDSFESFNLADRYQVPVILLADKYLAGGYFTVEAPAEDNLRIDRGKLVRKVEEGKYLRYKLTDDHVSPRSYPGVVGGIFTTTGDEHTEDGHITEGVEHRVAQMQKRMNKVLRVFKEIPPERQAIRYGPAEADLTVVSWGSTQGAILDAMDRLATEGISVNFVQLRLLWPFPAERIKALLARSKKIAAVEYNYSAQAAGILREQTGIAVDSKIVKYDGRPFSEDEIVSALRDVAKQGWKEVLVTDAAAHRV